MSHTFAMITRMPYSSSNDRVNIVVEKYADTIYMLAKDQDIVKGTLDQMDNVHQVFQQQELNIMYVPLLSVAEKIHVFLTIASRKKYNTLVQGSVRELLSNDRLSILPMVTHYMRWLKDSDEGYKYIVVEYAGKLNDDIKQTIFKYCVSFFGKNLIIKYMINPTINLGVRIFVDGRVWDFSYQHIVQQLGILELKDLSAS